MACSNWLGDAGALGTVIAVVRARGEFVDQQIAVWW